MGTREILVVSFGTTYDRTRRETIGAIEEAVRREFPDWEVRRAFTSGMILRSLRGRGILIDSVEEALERAAADGVKDLVIQPTHLMDGHEYAKLMDTATRHQSAFHTLRVGKPLLTAAEDFDLVIDAVKEELSPFLEEGTAAALMGHGTDASSNRVYALMQERMLQRGERVFFVGTVEGTPTIEDILPQIKSAGYRRVILMPLMVVAGDHACNDLAGEEDSWKTRFEAEGFQTVPHLRGLGALALVQKIYLSHVREAIGN